MQVQGTVNGLGERCGNANLVSIVANLQLKLGYHACRREAQDHREVSMLVYELANITPFGASPTSAAARSRTRPACTSPESSATPDL